MVRLPHRDGEVSDSLDELFELSKGEEELEGFEVENRLVKGSPFLAAIALEVGRLPLNGDRLDYLAVFVVEA